jgi:hypothetical protein
VPGGKAGYIYILQNPSMPGLLKIGKTTRSPGDRARELSAATGVPEAYIVVCELLVDDCVRAEQLVHKRLEDAGHRFATNREFFVVDISTAISAMASAQREVARR